MYTNNTEILNELKVDAISILVNKKALPLNPFSSENTILAKWNTLLL